MKKIGYDITIAANEKPRASQNSEATRFLKFYLRIHSDSNKPSNNERSPTQNMKAAGKKGKRSQATEALPPWKDESLRCEFDNIFTGKSSEVDILNAAWHPIYTALISNRNALPVYRNILLFQNRQGGDSLRVEPIATAFLEKMRAHFGQVGFTSAPKTNKRADSMRYRIDFSCLSIQDAEAYVVCPEKDKGNAFIRRPSSDYAARRASTYAHFVSKLPKWKNVSLMPDPEMFFQKVLRDSGAVPSSSPSPRTARPAGPFSNTVFVFHLYRSDTKELIAVVSIADIDDSFIDESSERIFRCLHGMKTASSTDPSSALRAYRQENVRRRAVNASTPKDTGIMNKFYHLLNPNEWGSKNASESDPFARYFRWYLAPKAENHTFFLLSVKSSSDIYVLERTVHVRLREGSPPVMGDMRSQASRTSRKAKKESTVKFVPIDLAPSVQYRLGPNCRRSRRSSNSKGRSNDARALTVSKKHCIAQTIRHQTHRKTDQIFNRTSAALLFQTLNVTKHVATEILRFLRRLHEHIDAEQFRPVTRVVRRQIVSSETTRESALCAPRPSEDNHAVSHEVNEMKVQIHYLTRKLEEHELRESMVSEKEAAIEQWEMRRETLNNSVEELVSLLNNQHQTKGMYSGDEGQSKLKHPLIEGFQGRPSCESPDEAPERDFDRLTDRETQTARSQDNSSENFYQPDDASHHSTPVSFIESYAESKALQHYQSPFDAKKSLFLTPLSIDSTRLRQGYASTVETSVQRSTARFYDKSGENNYLQIADENRMLRSKLDIMKSYVTQLESQNFDASANGAVADVVSAREGSLVTTHDPLNVQFSTIDHMAPTNAVIPSYVVSGMQRIHHYTDFLFDSCKRVAKMSVWLKRTMKKEMEAERLVDASHHNAVNEDNAKRLPGSTGQERRRHKLSSHNKTENLSSKDREPTSAPTPHGEQTLQMRSMREHIKKLMVKLSTKDKESTQWQTKVQRLTRELQMSGNKETNLRNQLDSIVQRNHMLMKDFTMFKKNLRKVDKETEKIQSQNKILKDQLEKIEQGGANVYQSTRKLRQDRPVRFIEREPLSSHFGLADDKGESLHGSRDTADEQSISTVMSARTFDEMSCYSMNISQSSSPVYSTIRPPRRLPVPKLSLDLVNMGETVEKASNAG